VKLAEIFARPLTWWIVAVAIALVMLALAVNNDVYNLTSPPTLDNYVLLRKLYSVVAFAAVGYPVARARRAAGASSGPLVIGLMIAGYSAVIEVLQFALDPPWEGLASSLFDVVCGLGGGLIGAYVARPRIRAK
jgi:hypothetical protein